jgi:hypothetical protein
MNTDYDPEDELRSAAVLIAFVVAGMLAVIIAALWWIKS